MTTDPETQAMKFPYSFRRAEKRERPPTRIESASLDRLRDLVAWLQAQGCPASLEQELTVAVEAHVAGMAARFQLTGGFPQREGDLPTGRRPGVWELPPHQRARFDKIQARHAEEKAAKATERAHLRVVKEAAKEEAENERGIIAARAAVIARDLAPKKTRRVRA